MWQKRIIWSHLEPFRETDNNFWVLAYCVNWQDNFLKKHIVIEG